MRGPDSGHSEPRYAIRRREGQTRCEDCELEYDNTGYVLWLTAAVARERGMTHCSQCGRALVPPEAERDG